MGYSICMKKNYHKRCNTVRNFFLVDRVTFMQIKNSDHKSSLKRKRKLTAWTPMIS
ncbi:hypothetical protein [Hoylesella pleuritidis]|uniref:hypothetical protein n=1 Tax=Hoylesella pleuritidis TaxID=407975 RepID=UPI0003FC9671|nr:hypothetical protein [Hoylesella pleuritidis]